MELYPRAVYKIYSGGQDSDVFFGDGQTRQTNNTGRILNKIEGEMYIMQIFSWGFERNVGCWENNMDGFGLVTYYKLKSYYI